MFTLKENASSSSVVRDRSRRNLFFAIVIGKQIRLVNPVSGVIVCRRLMKHDALIGQGGLFSFISSSLVNQIGSEDELSRSGWRKSTVLFSLDIGTRATCLKFITTTYVFKSILLKVVYAREYKVFQIIMKNQNLHGKERKRLHEKSYIFEGFASHKYWLKRIDEV